MNYKMWYCLIPLLSSVIIVGGVSLTFELSDKAKECFYEIIETNSSASLEFQVITGGQYDIDVSLEAPNREIIYSQVQQQFDSHSFIAPMTGEYKACFSNEFSTFSHKIVYMDFQVGDEFALPGLEEHVTVMTQMETSASKIQQQVSGIVEYQKSFRLREAQSRKRAEALNGRVLWGSLLETVAILATTVGQVLVLKNFFTERKPYQRL